jgi:thioredoxin reductase (NADPH)
MRRGVVRMHDVIIIGKGPAGVSAALYTARANIGTLMIGMDHSVLKTASKIENYYGFTEPISGNTLLNNGISQIQRIGVDVVEEEVIGVNYVGHFEVITTKSHYTSKSVILATGLKQKKISIQNLEKFEGVGISYCTTCDGFFFRGKTLGVIGWKDFVVHEAQELKAFSQDVTIYTNGHSLNLTGKYIEMASNFKQNHSVITRFEGHDVLEKIVFEDGSDDDIDGVFIATDGASTLDFARKLGCMLENNTVIVDKNQATNIEGLFAAGDCTGGFRQIATAVGEGALAGKSVIEWIRKKR